MIILKVKNDKISIFIDNIRIYLKYNDIIIIKSDSEAYFNNQKIDIGNNQKNQIYDYGYLLTSSTAYPESIFVNSNYSIIPIEEYRDQKLNTLLDD